MGDSRAENWQSSRHLSKHQPDILNSLRSSLVPHDYDDIESHKVHH